MQHHSDAGTGEKSQMRIVLSADPLTMRCRLNCKQVTNPECPFRVQWHLGVSGFSSDILHTLQQIISCAKKKKAGNT